MNLSTKNSKKLQLKDFLIQNLDEAPAPRIIEWVSRPEGIFRILWTHQSSGTFTNDDAALFRYWAIARGKDASLSSVELKQNFRMALNKSPYVELVSEMSHCPEYRYFRFKVGWSSDPTIHTTDSAYHQTQFHVPIDTFSINPGSLVGHNSPENNIMHNNTKQTRKSKKKSQKELFRPYLPDGQESEVAMGGAVGGGSSPFAVWPQSEQCLLTPRMDEESLGKPFDHVSNGLEHPYTYNPESMFRYNLLAQGYCYDSKYSSNLQPAYNNGNTALLLPQY